MNKKLLLILSILMSLSLLTMSCAKSVAAPEVSVTGQGITTTDITTELRKIGIIYANSQASSLNPEQYMDFSSLNLIEDETYTYTYLIYPNNGIMGWFNYTCDPNYVLNELKQRIPTFSSMKIEFVPNTDWDSGTPQGQKQVYFTININSQFLTVPDNLKTVKIRLMANWQ